MKSFTEILPAWTETLGWTLLNSVWQTLIIMVLVMIVLRIVPSKSSQLRYCIACSGLALSLLLSVATFLYLMDAGNSTLAETRIFYKDLSSSGLTTGNTPVTLFHRISQDFLTMVASNMPFIILCWITGAILFSLRMISSWWYVSRLKMEATIVDNDWNKILQSLANQLEIKRIVTLAQSGRIHAPIVIGCIKPVILVPVGMFSGLSTEQIETIFIHELAHIRRHDYIINLIQSFVETLFFFNPFIWILSNTIRQEREYCCDDTVVMKHGSALAYARALAQLEEARLTRSVLALSLAENKNQLLNRIKRIMEKSAKNYSGRDRMIPAVLLVIGLMCASWLTISNDQEKTGNELTKPLAAADTTIKKNQKSARVSRTTIITFDDNGKPHEQVFEEYEGDEDFRTGLAREFVVPPMPIDMIASIPPMESIMPVMSSMDIVISPVPALSVMEPLRAMAPFNSFHFQTDSIPLRRFQFNQGQNWEEFSTAFEEKFREQFKDFYKSHEEDFEKMMKEMEKQFANGFNEDVWKNVPDDMWSRAAQGADRFSAEEMKEEAEIHARAAEQEAKHAQEWEENHRDQFRQVEELMKVQEEQLKEMEQDLMEHEAHMKAFEKDLKVALVKDGYLGKDETLKTINWDDDGGIEINGKQIKDAHREKYNELHNKYFKKPEHLRKAE